MPTPGGLAGAKSATCRVSVLNRRTGMSSAVLATGPHDTADCRRAGRDAWRGSVYRVPVPMKLALVVRTDLDMGRGKIAAQVAHAAVAAVLHGLGGAVFHRWLEEGQPKVVLKVPDEGALDQVISQARAAELPLEL